MARIQDAAALGQAGDELGQGVYAVVQPQQAPAGPQGAEAQALVPPRQAAGQLGTLDEVLERVAGEGRTIIWGSASSDYLDFLVNW